MSTFTWKCPYCGRDDFKTQGGLTKHQKTTVRCKRKVAEAFGYDVEHMSAAFFMGLNKTTVGKSTNNMGDETNNAAVKENNLPVNATTQPQKEDVLVSNNRYTFSDDESDVSSVFGFYDASICSSEWEQNLKNGADVVPNAHLRSKFKSFCDYRSQHPDTMQPNMATAIRLLSELRSQKNALSGYEAMMRWHLCENGLLKPGDSLSSCAAYVNQKKVYEHLRHRHNLPKKGNASVKHVTLPHSRARVRICCNPVEDMMISLLSDPRITDDDYLFFDDHPFSPPPDKVKCIKDLNTGLSYTETYKTHKEAAQTSVVAGHFLHRWRKCGSILGFTHNRGEI